ncbi:MAG: diacylglycerol O-acyltransferase / wax synthase [Solirubrobacterales bacterium]|nr:diacylglycerol O-acyltransferase / wax synthase [Solirubrobacterales bacterium]
MAQRLSASDMSSWLADDGPIHVHVGGTTIMQGPAPDFDEFVDHVGRRLALVPRFRQRVTKTPLNLANPVWGDDPKFDVRRHVRRLRVPRPGGEAELRELVGNVMSEPLDKSRPPWQIYVVEGLAGNRHAFISKTHHALVDGVSAIDVGAAILDISPKGREDKKAKRWRPASPAQAALLAGAAVDLIGTPLRATGRAARTAVRSPAGSAARVFKTAEAFSSMAVSGPRVRRTFMNQEIGRDRRIGWQKATLTEVKRARGPVEGATVNDVILAVAAGGLRRLFKQRRIKLPEYVVALVPVSIRTADDQGELGNRIATILARLPIAERDPVKRLQRIHDETERLKASESVRASTLLIEAAGWAPPTVNRLLSQAMSKPLVFNLVVSNVPGPQIPLYMMGHRMLEVYPFVPLSPQGHALSLGVLSYDGNVFFGLVGDHDLMADIDDLSAAIGEAIAEQVAAKPPARRRAAAKPKPTKPKPKKKAAPRKRGSAPIRVRRRARRAGPKRRG